MMSCHYCLSYEVSQSRNLWIAKRRTLCVRRQRQKLPKPLPKSLRPADKEKQGERRSPVRGALNEVPDRHSDKRPYKRRPEAPERHPQEKDSDGTHQNKHREQNIQEAYGEQELCRKRRVRNTKLTKPPYPVLFPLERDRAVADKLSGDRDAKNPLRLF